MSDEPTRREKIALLRIKIERLAHCKTELDSVQEDIARYRENVSELMQELGLHEFQWSGLLAHYAKNSPSRRIDYELLQRSYPELYSDLCEKDIITYTEPKESMRLVIDAAKEKRENGTA